MKSTVLMLFIVLFVSSCQTNEGPKDPDVISLNKVPDIPNYTSYTLVGPTWKLIGFVNHRTGTIMPAKPDEEHTYILNFSEDNSVKGITSTNGISGYYTANNIDIKIIFLKTTLVNEIYDGLLYIDLTSQVSSYKLSKKGLFLFYKKDKSLLYKPVKYRPIS